MKFRPIFLMTIPSCQKLYSCGQTFVRLFQEFIRFPSQGFGDADQTGQRKIVFRTFDAADKCPVHIGAFGQRFLRPGHFFSKSSHIFCHPLAILDVHDGRVWKKKSQPNIDVSTIEFTTSPRCYGKICRILLANGGNLRENGKKLSTGQ